MGFLGRADPVSFRCMGSQLTTERASFPFAAQLALLALDGFERCAPTKLLPPPLLSSCGVAPGARLLLTHEHTEVSHAARKRLGASSLATLAHKSHAWRVSSSFSMLSGVNC